MIFGRSRDEYSIPERVVGTAVKPSYVYHINRRQRERELIVKTMVRTLRVKLAFFFIII